MVYITWLEVVGASWVKGGLYKITRRCWWLIWVEGGLYNMIEVVSVLHD